MPNIELSKDELLALQKIVWSDKLNIGAPGAKLLSCIQDKIDDAVKAMPSENGANHV